MIWLAGPHAPSDVREGLADPISSLQAEPRLGAGVGVGLLRGNHNDGGNLKYSTN